MCANGFDGKIVFKFYILLFTKSEVLVNDHK